MGRVVLLSAVAAMMALTLASGLETQSFTLTGYQNLTGPGDAHLLLRFSSMPQAWANSSLRVEISGPTSGALILPKTRTENDLGFFSLAAGNYSVGIYVVERLGPTLQESGEVLYHGETAFSVPQAPAAPEEKKPLIDPVDLGFMVTALVVFGLLLTIIQTDRSRHGEQPGDKEA